MSRVGGKRAKSLRNRMIALVLLCWILPLMIVTIVAGVAITGSINNQITGTAKENAYSSADICTQRISSAIDSSRYSSYNFTIADAHSDYMKNEDYVSFYQEVNLFLMHNYSFDDKFMFTSLSFYNHNDKYTENISKNDIYAINESLFPSSRTETGRNAYSRYAKSDTEELKEYGAALGTRVGFKALNGSFYMLRNIYNLNYSSTEPLGLLTMRLNTNPWFDSIINSDWTKSVMVTVNDEIAVMYGDEIKDGILGDVWETYKNDEKEQDIIMNEKSFFMCGEQKDRDFELAYAIEIDKSLLMKESRYLTYLLAALAILTIPLMILVIRFFYKSVSKPVNVLEEGADMMKKGELGYQISYVPNSNEFIALTTAFNDMSEQLKHQFERIYSEELALKDAKIMALQSQINPHFLNNTLEIINWEARLGNSEKVSRMIEALSTMLDAAMDREGKPIVHLSQEMMYVDAYLYIIGERFGKRLKVHNDIDQSLLDLYVPRLIMQPIIENAVEHGVSQRQSGEITIRIRKEDTNLVIEIENDGKLTEEAEQNIERMLSQDYVPNGERSAHLGIRNVNERLRIIYGENSGLSIKMNNKGVTVAKIIIPID